MRKVHIHSDCWFFAGCENMIEVLLNSNELKKYFEFSFSCRRTDDYVKAVDEKIKDKNITVHYCNIYPTKRFLNKVEDILYFILTPFLITADIFMLIGILMKEKPDILYINNGGYPAARTAQSAVLAGKICGIKRIYYCVNNIATPYKSIRRKFNWPLDRLIKNSVTNFLTASKFAGDKLAEVLDIKRKDILQIYNVFKPKHITVSLEDMRKQLNCNENDILIGSVGLLEERKGFNYLIEAISQIKQQNIENVKLVIVGFGPEQKNLKTLISDKDLGEVISILPNQDNIFNYYNAFDIFVLSSVAYDDLPFTIREAMFMGLPIVATDFAGIPEVVDNEVNGLLVEPRNAEQLSEALIRLVKDKDLRIKFGNESKRIYSERLSLDNSIKEYKKLFQR